MPAVCTGSPGWTASALRRLGGSARPGLSERPPVGVVHLGAGAFHRAHQAAFTEDVPEPWGICAVAPRRHDAVEQLAPQDGLFTLLVRHPDEDRAQVIGCLREVLHAPSEPEAGRGPDRGPGRARGDADDHLAPAVRLAGHRPAGAGAGGAHARRSRSSRATTFRATARFWPT